MRTMEAGPDGIEFLAFGAGDDPRDAELVPGWWSDEPLSQREVRVAAPRDCGGLGWPVVCPTGSLRYVNRRSSELRRHR